MLRGRGVLGVRIGSRCVLRPGANSRVIEITYRPASQNPTAATGTAPGKTRPMAFNKGLVDD